MALGTVSHPAALMADASSVRRTRRPMYQMEDSGWAVLRKALDQELPVPRKPRAELPPLPEDLSDLPDSALMKLFGQLTQWQKYLGTQLALAEVDEKSSARTLARVEKGYDFRKPGDKVRAAADPAYEAAIVAAQDTFAYRRLVDALHGSVDSDAFLCSRELTRRLGTADRDHRNARLNT
jgi:hypothetical protein